MTSMDQIVSLCKRRGFVFQSSEIYGGLSAVYDWGPYGVELARNVGNHWWREMVQKHDNIVGLDAAIFMLPQVWEASGHVGGFADPLVEYKLTNERFRVDQLLSAVGVEADEKMGEEELQSLFDENFEKLALPSKKREEFSPVRRFNLLVQSNLGNVTNDLSNPVYLRGETAQGIYVNYKNVLDTTRVKIPFGIAQMGKAFRNEITARQFIFRTREFEQMEMQYFVNPAAAEFSYEQWRQTRFDYYTSLGINQSKLRWAKHEHLVFYAKAAYDIEYEFPFGFAEVEGVHARGDYDLSVHMKASGVDLTYKDAETGESFVPQVVETSTGVARNVLMHLCDGYTEEEVNGETRTVLKLNPALAPIKVAVFPLLKNKPELVARAREIFDDLKLKYRCEFDDNGNIGKRYRRQDEIGTPFCVTIDFDSLEKGDVTVRERDSMKQERISNSKFEFYLQEKLSD